MTYLMLFSVFFRIGLFTIGGGLASLPLLYNEMVDGGFLSRQEFIDMLAVSQSTPGPIGINMATYTGYKIAGITGSITATVGMAAPSFIIIIIIASFIRNFDKNKYIRSILYVLRALSLGLIASAAWYVFANSVITEGISIFESSSSIFIKARSCKVSKIPSTILFLISFLIFLNIFLFVLLNIFLKTSKELF